MSAGPRISLCIPTYNRAAFCRGALESGLREVAALPPGTAELLVCDNASTDQTWAMISMLQAAHPGLRAFRNAKHVVFDRNYMRCVEEARGEFIWIMGDDDVWMPGSVARVLRELEAGADACLCQAEACDGDLNPVIVLPWYLGPEPPKVWHLDSRDDLIRYFDGCARNAGIFAFISVAIFLRERFLANRESIERALKTGYPHLWGMLEFLRRPTCLHYIPDVLVRNRISDWHADSNAKRNLYATWRHELVTWAQIADTLLGDDLELHHSFSRILGRNHHNTILPGMRNCAANEAEWQDVVPLLVRAGFSPVQVAAVDFAFHQLQNGRLPMPSLDTGSLCIADLGLLARGAQRVAILALAGAPSLLDGAGLLTALRRVNPAARIRIFCSPDGAPTLEGFEVEPLDPGRYRKDEAYRSTSLRALSEFSPELVLNLDPGRGSEADALVDAALPTGALAFASPEPGQAETSTGPLDGRYTRLIPPQGGAEAMLEALGLERLSAPR